MKKRVIGARGVERHAGAIPQTTPAEIKQGKAISRSIETKRARAGTTKAESNKKAAKIANKTLASQNRTNARIANDSAFKW